VWGCNPCVSFLGLSQGAVSGDLSRARAAGASWPLPADLDDEQLEALLFLPPSAIAADQRPMPDWAWVHRELRRPNVTLALLWEEYRASAPDGFGYFLVLRPLPGLGGPAEADDAPDPYRRREAVCRLRWPYPKLNKNTDAEANSTR
jgi:hypothetical protein